MLQRLYGEGDQESDFQRCTIRQSQKMLREVREHCIKKVKLEHSLEGIPKALRCAEGAGAFQTDETTDKNAQRCDM